MSEAKEREKFVDVGMNSWSLGVEPEVEVVRSYNKRGALCRLPWSNPLLACSNLMTCSDLPGPGATPEQLADRLHIIGHNQLAIQMALAGVRTSGSSLDVVVVVIDARDSLGRQIARQVDPERRAQAIAGPNAIPTLLVVVSRRLAISGLRRSHPRIAAGLVRPAPTGVAPVICIASEGITMVHMSIVQPPAAVEA